MKKEQAKLIFIYVLLIVVIFLIVALFFVVKQSQPKKEENTNTTSTTQTVEVSQYPNVSTQCIFNITYQDYTKLTTAGCQGGYTRYNLTDVAINGTKLNISIIYSDKNQPLTGLFINNKRVLTKVASLQSINLGIFDNKLFVLNTSSDAINVLAYSNDGQKLYDLNQELTKDKITDELLTSATKTVSQKNLDPSSFSFINGSFSFKTKEKNSQTNGSTFIVTYSGTTFGKPTIVK
jgi:hypothetical protein